MYSNAKNEDEDEYSEEESYKSNIFDKNHWPLLFPVYFRW